MNFIQLYSFKDNRTFVLSDNYLGCFFYDSNAGYSISNLSNNTNEKCLNLCFDRKYRYSLTQKWVSSFSFFFNFKLKSKFLNIKN